MENHIIENQQVRVEECPYFEGCETIFKNEYYCFCKYKKCIQYQVYRVYRGERIKMELKMELKRMVEEHGKD
ncbi:MAG: hypothetical protein EU529_05915 [Promethearchaeota archaeon]|nr:MAG: hypothetical protein EU529_05915 [Candidatus Lokiarchaeota archaeon]